MSDDLKGQRVLSSSELQLVAVNKDIHTLVGVTPTLLTRPSGKTTLVLDSESGSFRYRIGDFSLPGNTDLIVTGNFASDTGWTLGTGWSIAGGVALMDGTQVSSAVLSQALAIEVGRSYELVFTVGNYVDGGVTPVLAGKTGTIREADGTFTETIVAGIETDLLLEFIGNEDFDGDLDDVTLKWETDIVVNGAFAADTDWPNQDVGWSIAAGKASSDASQVADDDLTQTSAVTIIAGEYYEVIFTVSGRTVGAVTPIVGDVEGTDRTTNAKFTEVIQADATNQLIGLRADATFDGDVDNLSITVATLQSTAPAITQTAGNGSLKIRVNTPITLSAASKCTVVGSSGSDVLTYYWI